MGNEGPIPLPAKRHISHAAPLMTSIEPGLYLRISELEDGPNPFPLRNGFAASDAYSAQGLFNPSEFAESHPAIHTWPEEKFVTNEVPDAGFSYTIAASRLLFSHQSTAHLNPGGLLSFQVAPPFAQSPTGINTVTAPGQTCGVVRPLLVSISPSGGQWMTARASRPVNPAGLPPADFDEVIRLRGLTSLRRCNGHTNQGPMALSIFLHAMLAPRSPVALTHMVWHSKQQVPPIAY